MELIPGAWEGAVPEVQLDERNAMGDVLAVRKKFGVQLPSLPPPEVNKVTPRKLF